MTRRHSNEVITFTWPMQQRVPWWRRVLRLVRR